MNIYTVGIEHLIANELKEKGYTVNIQNNLPSPSLVGSNCLIVTSHYVELNNLSEFRENYPDAKLIYQYLNVSVRGYRHIQLLCEKENIIFLSPRATSQTIEDQLRLLIEGSLEKQSNIIGVFGSGVGVGVTTVSHTLAKQIASQGKSVCMLGLDLFDPGYSYKPSISLDQIRPRLKGKVLKDEDFKQLISIENYMYLPGNFDFIGALDYQEEEIEFLLDQATESADIVIADFGSIPESAAYYVGVQKATIRLFVSHYQHEYKVQQIMNALSHLDIMPQDFLMIVNRSDYNRIVSAKSFAAENGMLFGHDFSLYSGMTETGHLPLGRKEMATTDTFAKALIESFNNA